MMLKYTPRRFTPVLFVNSIFVALVDHGFIVLVPFKSLDELVPGLDELFVLCRSPCEPSDLTQWPPVMDENSTETTGHLKMTVLCEFWSQAFSLFSNMDPCTIQCPDKQQIHLTPPSLRSSSGGLYEIATCFQCFGKRAQVAVVTSGDQEDVISVSEIGFDVPLLSHFLLQDVLSLHHCQKNGITDFTTRNKSNA